MAMERVVDLHIHSKYSRATSRNCDLEGLYKWGKLKGIHVIGTGDFTHPEWFNELRDKLVPSENGLFRLKPEISSEIDKTLPASVKNNPITFVPTVEIATIYKKGDKVRKLHQVIVAETFEDASKIIARLERIGNLKADGRPILGLDSKELLRIQLECAPTGLYIPAHIWTPWFGLFGSKSGFDSLQEAYDELAPQIRAIETGLSSDPAMNWRVENLDNVAIISNSDAHSPQKLGREATIIGGELTYANLIDAIKTNDSRLKGTIEFFPEEGKYHADGHRDCGVRTTPEETANFGGICPSCTKPLVVGVQNRVGELAIRPQIYAPKNPKHVEYIIPLAEIIAELRGVKSVVGKAVQSEYQEVLARLGDEFSVLRSVPLDAVEAAGYPLLKMALERMRQGQVVREPGFDGVFGTIKVFKDAAERQDATRQLALL